VTAAARVLIVEDDVDLEMPVMDGTTFRLHQAAHVIWAQIPVVVVSGERSAETVATSWAAAGCLGKPVNLPELLKLIAQFCSPARVA
jgi:CheY-like chemotaxis protein